MAHGSKSLEDPAVIELRRFDEVRRENGVSNDLAALVDLINLLCDGTSN